MALFGHGKRPVGGRTETDDFGMNESCEEALADEPLKPVVGSAVALTCPTKEFEFDRKTATLAADYQIEAMKPVEPNRCPGLAGFPAIGTTVNIRGCKKPRAGTAIGFTRFLV